MHDFLLYERAGCQTSVLPRPCMGITRLNVYAGEAAGYVITDAVDQDMMMAVTCPAST